MITIQQRSIFINIQQWSIEWKAIAIEHGTFIVDLPGIDLLKMVMFQCANCYGASSAELRPLRMWRLSSWWGVGGQTFMNFKRAYHMKLHEKMTQFLVGSWWSNVHEFQAGLSYETSWKYGIYIYMYLISTYKTIHIYIYIYIYNILSLYYMCIYI